MATIESEVVARRTSILDLNPYTPGSSIESFVAQECAEQRTMSSCRPQVVVVKECNESAPRQCEPDIACRRWSTAWTIDQRDSWIAAMKPISCPISRGIVDNDNLIARAQLRQYRRERLIDELLSVEHRNDHSRGRWFGHPDESLAWSGRHLAKILLFHQALRRQA
jgi:hypothetical protein